MTNDEILGKADFDVHYYSEAGRRDILSAMDEYAKQECIEFDKWKAECSPQQSDNLWYIKNNPHGLKAGYYTTEQLCEEYFKSKPDAGQT